MSNVPLIHLSCWTVLYFAQQNASVLQKSVASISTWRNEPHSIFSFVV